MSRNIFLHNDAAESIVELDNFLFAIVVKLAIVFWFICLFDCDAVEA